MWCSLSKYRQSSDRLKRFHTHLTVSCCDSLRESSAGGKLSVAGVGGEVGEGGMSIGFGLNSTTKPRRFS